MPVILHSDLNNFYASCECLINPSLKGLPVAVCGRVSDRHGIILAKNYLAKSYGIKTGMTVFEAKKLAPDVVAVEANHDLYYYYSKRVKKIYLEYTDKVEAFGIDEAWLDVTDCVKLFGSGENIANIIRKRIKEEIGLTVSIGVSYNKIFAKLGSDLKKPDAVSVITEDNYKKVVWDLSVSDLLFIGKSTQKVLNNMGIFTIGSLARASLEVLKSKFGKCGETMWLNANGKDPTTVRRISDYDEIKSVGNSTTFYRDIENIEDISALICMLSESVVYRMKRYDVGYARTLYLSLTDSKLCRYGAQEKFAVPTNCSQDLVALALKIYYDNFADVGKIRGIGVSVCDFIKEEQMLLGKIQQSKNKNKLIDFAVENIRSRYGKNSIYRGLILNDERFKKIEINGANITSRVGNL